MQKLKWSLVILVTLSGWIKQAFPVGQLESWVDSNGIVHEDRMGTISVKDVNALPSDQVKLLGSDIKDTALANYKYKVDERCANIRKNLEGQKVSYKDLITIAGVPDSVLVDHNKPGITLIYFKTAREWNPNDWHKSMSFNQDVCITYPWKGKIEIVKK